MKVVLVRLTSGEQFAAEESGDANGALYVLNPIALVPDREHSSVNFVPWVPFGKEDSEVAVQKTNIVYVTEANAELERNYKEIRSPIITPNNGGKIIT